MSKRRSDEEIRADFAAKLAKIDARTAKRKAREASSMVRELERDYSRARAMVDAWGPAMTLGAYRDLIRSTLDDARAKALEPQP